MGGHI